VLLTDPQKVHDNNSGNDHMTATLSKERLDSLVQLHELLSRHMEQSESISAAAL
jgi:hypothetical protein